jgi:hypothetical protein
MSTAINHLPSVPPWVLDPSARWVTAREFSILYRRSQRRIQQMIKNGDILVFGVSTYQDAQGRWWIRLPA